MIHVFSYRDKNYIYDVGSGSLHECDKTTADYLKAKEEGQDVDITYISDEEIKNILADVEGLKESLFYIQYYFIKKELIHVKHEYIIEVLDEKYINLS